MDRYRIRILIDQHIRKDFTLIGKLTVQNLEKEVLFSTLSDSCQGIYLYLSRDGLSSNEGDLPAAIIIQDENDVENILWKGSFLMKGKVNLFYEWYTMARYLETLNDQKKIRFYLDLTGQDIKLSIYARESVFMAVADPEDELGTNSKKYSGLKDNLKSLLQCFYELKDDSVQYGTSVKKKKRSVEELYHYIQEHCKTHGKNLDHSVLSMYQCANLWPTLRQYQAEAIHWMVCKERFDCSSMFIKCYQLLF